MWCVLAGGRKQDGDKPGSGEGPRPGLVPTEQDWDPEEAPGPGVGAVSAPTPSSSSPLFWGCQGWCRLVTAAYNYFHVTNFFWMFGEGCYLHTAIVLTYSTDRLRKWMFICIGWGEPGRLPPGPGPAGPAALSSPRARPAARGLGVGGQVGWWGVHPPWGWGRQNCHEVCEPVLNPCPALGPGLHWGPPGPASPQAPLNGSATARLFPRCAFPHHCGLGHWQAVLRQ